MNLRRQLLSAIAFLFLAAGSLQASWKSSPLPENVRASTLSGAPVKIDSLGVWNIWPEKTKIAVDDVWDGALPVRIDIDFTPADCSISWPDSRLLSLYDASGEEFLTVDAIRRGRFRLSYGGGRALSRPVLWETTVVHWGRLTPGVVSVILFRDHAVLAVRGFAVATARGTVSPRLPLRAELGAREDSDRGLHGWYNGLSASAFDGVMPPEAPLPGKAEWSARVDALNDFIWQEKDFTADVPTPGQVEFQQARRAALRLAVDSLWYRLHRNNEVCFELFLEAAEKMAAQIREDGQPNRIWRFNDERRGAFFLAPDDDDFYGGVCGWGLGSRAPEFAMMGVNLVSEHVWPGATFDNQGNFDPVMLIRSTMISLEQYEKYHIRFDLMVAPYTPGWLLDKHPEWDGTFVGFGVENESGLLALHEQEWKGRQAGHGWLKASAIHPDYRGMCEKFLANVLPVIAKSKALVAIDLANEVQFEDYTPEMQSRFRAWLLKKYGTLAAVNAAWKTSFTDIGQIVMARPIVHDRGNAARFWDWNLFNREQGTDFFVFMKGLCDKYAPGIPTHIKHLPHEFGVPWLPAGSPDHNFYDYADGIDRMSLARLTPIIGTDSWADNGHDRHGRLSTDAPYQTAYFSLLGNFAPEKRIFDSEWHILRCDPPVTTPDCLDMIMKQNVTCNLKAGTSWVCCPGINQKLDISSTPQVMLQIGLATASIREAIALYDAVARRPRPVAFFYSPHSRYLDNVDHVKALLNLSEGAMFSGVSFRIIDERQLIDGQIAPETVPLVIVPRCPLPDPRSLDALKAYARLGGKVVFSGVFGALEAAAAAREVGGSHQPLSGRPEQIPAELGDLARAHGLYPEVEVTDADGRPAWGIQWHVAHTADGKAVLYAANLGKKPQSLVVKGARRLVDGNTGEGKAPALDLAVHDTFIGYLE